MNNGGDGNMNPTIIDRIRRIGAPGWLRSVFVRRAVAVALIACAVVATVAQQRGAESATTLVAARDLRPGVALSAADVRVVPVPDQLLPTDGLGVSDATGRQVTGLVRAGEILSRHRLLDSRLPSALTGSPDARLVPVRPADQGLITLVRGGDLVDLLTEDSDVLAEDAVIAVTPTPADNTSSGAASVVLVAMRERDAHRVAAANLRGAITFVLH